MLCAQQVIQKGANSWLLPLLLRKHHSSWLTIAAAVQLVVEDLQTFASSRQVMLGQKSHSTGQKSKARFNNPDARWSQCHAKSCSTSLRGRHGHNAILKGMMGGKSVPPAP